MYLMIQVAQLLLSLSILVFFHELGHFTFAKIFKTRVEKFYLFFNPWFSIFKFKKGETEYGLGWLPLGGYVKIAGMIDESMDKEAMKLPPQPWEFRSKPAWQRLLIMIGGVLVNFILAFVIYISVLAVWGEQKLSVDEVNKYGIVVDSLGMEFGLQTGDKIVSVNGNIAESMEDAYIDLILTSPRQMTVDRNGKEVTIEISKKQISQILRNGPFFSPRFPFIVKNFADTSVAKDAGLMINDKVIAVNGEEMQFMDEIRTEIISSKNNEVELTVLRNEKDTFIFNMVVPESTMIGVELNDSIPLFYHIDSVEYTLAQAFPAGVKKTFREVDYYLKQLKLVFTPKTKAYKSVGSFITIGKLFPKKWDWRHFWTMTALLSIMLGVVNLFPIPALDGGHVMFTLYEMIVGKKPSDKFLERAQIVGMVLLLALIVLALGNDFINYVF
ncbi:MAG: RIP metalloprotease RseP [Bacteroidales bacterium]|nr:RIP metalloprotease RseP [Bacteroidales bacterium]